MRKAFELLMGSASLALVHASPFVGEHADKSSVDHGNGRVSMRMKAVKTNMNKYESLLYKGELFKDRKSPIQQFSDLVFGPEVDESVPQARIGTSFASTTSDYAVPLRNPDGTMWVGEVIMGGVKTMEVVYDTGSDWLVIESHTCSNCEGDKYDPRKSTGKPKQISKEMSERNYGSASLKGHEWTDKVCLTLSTCVPEFEFFMFEQQSGIAEPIDGILGLSRNNAFHIAPDQGNMTGPLYIETLAKDGLVSEDKFSFFFQHPDEDSWMDIGEPDLDIKKPGTEYVETQFLDPDFFWGFYNTGIAIGDIENSFAYEPYPDLPEVVFKDNSLYSIIDTGSTALVISVVWYESLIRNLFETAGIDDWRYEQGVILTKCQYELPSLFFQIDGKWVEAKAVDYMFDYSGDGVNCLLFIMPANMAMNILGMPIHVDYYTIHDPVAGTVNWAPHYKSPKKTVQSGPVPPPDRLILAGEPGPDPLTLVFLLIIAAGVCYGAIMLW